MWAGHTPPLPAGAESARAPLAPGRTTVRGRTICGRAAGAAGALAAATAGACTEAEAGPTTAPKRGATCPEPEALRPDDMARTQVRPGERIDAATRARGAGHEHEGSAGVSRPRHLGLGKCKEQRGDTTISGRPKASLRESRSERLRQHLGSTSFEWCECVRKARVAVFLYVSPSLELDKGWVGRRKETHVNSNVAASGSEILSSPPREDERRARPSNQPAHGVMARVENETGSPLSRCRPGLPPRGCPQVCGRRRRSATRGSSSPLATSRAWSSRRRPRWRL